MNARALLARLREQGIVVELHGEVIEIDAPRGVLDDDTRLALRRLRPRLRLILQAEASRPCGAAPVPDAASALELKHLLAWDALTFSRFCQTTIGRPGPASIAEDEQVLDAMLDEVEEEPR